MNSISKNIIRTSIGTSLGAVGGGLLGNKLGESWSKKELEQLKTLTLEFTNRLKRQPRMYSLFVQLEREVKNSSMLPAGEDKKESQKLALVLTQKFLKGLTDKDKKLYLKIQDLTDRVYKIQSNSINMGVTVGGVIGLIIGGKLNKK